jgi:N6-adenosine-specific RNA methylase IME4
MIDQLPLIDGIAIPAPKYRTILCDPPWPEFGGGKIKRGADRHYPLMKVKEIAALPVASLSQDDSHLYLWVTNNFLPDGIDVMRAWGYHYISTITWIKLDEQGKPQIGLGQYYRGVTEHLLFGRRGQPPYKIIDGKRQQGMTAIVAPRRKHSEKPDEQYPMIERVSYGPFVELFARQQPPDGWSQWGNEVESNIVFEPDR